MPTHGDLFEEGELEGLWTYWNKRGQKESEGIYKKGKGEGLWTFWHNNGQKLSEGVLKGVKKEGLWVYWDKDGHKELEEIYNLGELISVKEGFEDSSASE